MFVRCSEALEQLLILNNNAITVIRKGVLSQSQHPFLTTIDLGDNKFQCDCSIIPLQNWIREDNIVKIESVYNHYLCFSPESEKGSSITSVNLDCESHLWSYIVIGIASTFVVLIVAIVMVRYRWHIKYRWFLMFNRRYQQHYLIANDERMDDDEDGIPRYDAYVPYHIDDEDWVDGELLQNIERGEERFRLCLRRRDIRAGRLLFNEISLHMQRSRKFLVILSPRFVEDNMCYFELNMTHHRVLEEGRNVMIFILLEDIPDNKMTLLLRQLF